MGDSNYIDTNTKEPNQMSVILFIAFFALYSTLIYTPQPIELNTETDAQEYIDSLEIYQESFGSEDDEEVILAEDEYLIEQFSHLNSLGIRDLRPMAKEQGIKGFMKMSKDQLISYLI